MKKIETGAIAGYSSNFRTFGSEDPLRPYHRESGIRMTKPNGIELRIFDHFDTGYFKELCRLVIYVAENSRIHHTKKYVYQNPHWIKAIQSIMMNGWKAVIPKEYVDELRNALGLKINTKSLIAYNVLMQINKELFTKNKNGDYSYLMLDSGYESPPNLPQINRRSWEMGLMIKLHREPELLDKFHKMIYQLPKMEINLDKYSKILYHYFL